MKHISLLLILLLLHHAAADLVHIPLSRRSLAPSRAFSHANRPWAARLAKTLSTDTSAAPILSWPLHLANIRVLPEQTILGDIISLGEYYVTLTFDRQPINVQIDTGSSTLAVPASECLNCRPHDHRLNLSKTSSQSGFISCNSHLCRRDTCYALTPCQICSQRRACCSLVKTDSCGFFLQYADSSGASGALVQTNVAMAHLSVPLVFGAILLETPKFENNNVDGIFGMAYRSLACNPTCVTPLFDAFVQTGKVKRDIFSMCIARHGGTLTLGGSNHNLFHGSLKYVPMRHHGTKHFYNVAVNVVHVGSQRVDVPDFSDAIVDSGTTLLVIAPRSYKALKAHFQTYYCDVPGLCPQSTKSAANVSSRLIQRTQLERTTSHQSNFTEKSSTSASATWFSPGYCIKLGQEHVDMLPSITIGLENGVKLVLEPDVYMLKYEMSSPFAWNKVVYRCLGISFLQGLERMENNAILGSTVLQKYFVEYDRENDRVGFAVARNCVNADSRAQNPASLVDTETSSGLPNWLMVTMTFLFIAAWIVTMLLCAHEGRKYNGYSPIPENTAS